MDLAFGDRDIRQICENKNIAIEKYDTFVAGLLQNRLADLLAATSLNDIIVGEPTLVFDKTFKINLGEDLILLFSANNRRLRINSLGNIDWSSVSRIKILSIEPQHLAL